jgi:hypothetical protein
VTAIHELNTAVRIGTVLNALLHLRSEARNRKLIRAFFVSPANKAAAASRIARHEVRRQRPSLHR